MNVLKGFYLPELPNPKIPMAFPSGRNKIPQKGTILAADIGGTKTELALCSIVDGRICIIKNDHYPTTDHDSFIGAISDFVSTESVDIDCACLGVAGPVDGDKVHGINFAWEIDAKIIAKEISISKVLLINDLQANAYGLPALDAADFETVSEGKAEHGNAAILSPGTGLGEAGLYWDGLTYHPFATEGGHCNFGPTDDTDIAILSYYLGKFGHLSWERLVSGQGIHNIYQFLRQTSHTEEPEWLTDQFKTTVPQIIISKAALEGKDPVCAETLRLFLKYLSMEAAQLALKTKAVSGIYIGGGIIPQIIPLIDKEVFHNNFISNGRMQDMLKDIPINIVMNGKTAMMGASYYAAMEMPV